MIKKVIAGENDLQTLYPQIAEEWAVEMNGDTFPSNVYPGTHTKYWWKCRKCGNEWETAVRDRVKGRNCPECAKKQRGISIHNAYLLKNNNLATVRPDLAFDWDYEKNYPLTPESVTPSTAQKVWWKCSVCGSCWQAKVNSRNNGNGCPKCNTVYHVSFPEKALLYYLKMSFPEVTENTKFDWLKGQEIDIYLPSYKIAIEYDGNYWHKDTVRDNQKAKVLQEHGILLFRMREPGCPLINDGSIIIHIQKVEKNYSHLNEAVRELYFEIIQRIGNVFIPDIDIIRDNTLILATYRKYRKDKSIIIQNPELVKEWNYEKNGQLVPEMITSRNDAKVWWICSKCGHEWKAAIGSRSRGIGCPACGIEKRITSAHRIRVEKKDKILAYSNPELLEDWDYNKNNTIGIQPTELSRGSTTKVWWKCHVCGNEWEASANQRTNKSHSCGCSVCSQIRKKEKLSKKNLKSEKDSLAMTNPELVIEWDYKKNGNRGPYEYTSSSGYKVWWICKKCGYNWLAIISNRSRGAGCPECGRHRSLKQVK